MTFEVSVIIPTFNRRAMLLEAIDSVLAQSNQSFELIVIDDGSTDGTAQLLDDHTRAGVIVGHHSSVNHGKGAAIRIGITLASGDIVLIQDGDLEYDPNDYAKLIDPILKDTADIVYGSRFLGKPTGMALKNRIANWILTASANLLYNARLTDEATAYKAFRTSILRAIHLECRHFEFCPEVTAKARRLGHRIHEVPIGYNARGIAEGKKIRARDGFEALWTLLKFRYAKIPLTTSPATSVSRKSRPL